MPENKMDSCKEPDGYRRREQVFGDMSARIYHEKASWRLDFNGTLRARLEAVIKVGMLPVLRSDAASWICKLPMNILDMLIQQVLQHAEL